MSDAGEPAISRTFPRIRGVSLSQYAGVQAGIGAGLPLESVLANEGVAPGAWQRAEDAWGERIAESVAGDGSLHHAFNDRMVAAQARYGRRLPPLDEDLGAWLDFVRRWSSAPDPSSELSRLGLRVSDVASLHRLWLKRMSADPSLAAQAQELLQRDPGEVSILSPGLPVVAKPPADDSVAVEVESAAAFDGVDAGELVEDDAAELDVDLEREQAAPPLFVPLPGDAEQAHAPAEAAPLLQPPPPVTPPSLSPEALAAMMAVPVDFPGATTLPLGPSEQEQAAAKKPLPFRPARSGPRSRRRR